MAASEAGAAGGRHGALFEEIVVDRLDPNLVALEKILGRRVPPFPLAATKFWFDIDAAALAAAVEPAEGGAPSAALASALMNAVRRVFVAELPGRAITYDREAGTFESTEEEMQIEFVVFRQIEMLPLSPGAPEGVRLALDVEAKADEGRTVYSDDLRVVGRGRSSSAPPDFVNPGFPLAYLRPGSRIRVTGLTVTEDSPSSNPRFSMVPRVGGEPLGLPLRPELLARVGGQTKATEEEVRAGLETLIGETYLPDELRGELRAAAKAKKGGVVEGLAVGEDGPFVSLADVSRYAAPAETDATGWRLTGWAAAIPAGVGICRQLTQQAVRHLDDQLKLLAASVDDADRVVPTLTEDKGRARLELLAKEFTVTVGDFVCECAKTSEVTADALYYTHEQALRLTVDAPGGEAETRAALRAGIERAQRATRALLETLRNVRERKAAGDEVTTTLRTGL